MKPLTAAFKVALYPIALFMRKEFVPAALLLLFLLAFFGIAMACLSCDELCPYYPRPAEVRFY